MKKKKDKKIPTKNYFYTFLMLIIAVGLVLYIFSWYKVKQEEKLMNSYLISSKTINYKIDDINTLSQTLKEAPLSYFVLISFRENEDNYKMEKSLKRTIDKYKLNELFYYVDATNDKDNLEYKNKLNKLFNTKEIEELPVLLYIEEGKTKEILKEITVDNFKKLLDSNGFEIIK